jgi:hypothetical protein
VLNAQGFFPYSQDYLKEGSMIGRKVFCIAKLNGRGERICKTLIGREG